MGTLHQRRQTYVVQLTVKLWHALWSTMIPILATKSHVFRRWTSFTECAHIFIHNTICMKQNCFQAWKSNLYKFEGLGATAADVVTVPNSRHRTVLRRAPPCGDMQA